MRLIIIGNPEFYFFNVINISYRLLIIFTTWNDFVPNLDIFARRDYMEFFVETIIDHRGNIKRKTDLEFLVGWLGYDDRDNSWEPYSNLRDTGKLHDYLTQNNMRQLIPAKFR
jgi:Chromo (CHRromatin Organisation MOdifier) domain